MRRLLLALSILSLISLPVWAQEAPPPPKPPEPTRLEVSATADVNGTPDVATINAGVVTQAATAAAALADNAAAMNKVFAALKALGIEAANIQTSGLSVNPDYVYKENQPPKVSSYQATNTVNVRLTKLDTVGAVIDALVKEGSNQINGPTFSIDKPDGLIDNARKDAMATARKRAELFAAAAGMKVGRILNISESSNTSPPPGPVPMMRMAAAVAAPTPVSAGQMNMSATVNVVFELTP